MDVQIPTSHSTQALRKLFDELEKLFRSLEALGQDVSLSDFIYMIHSKLPREVVVQLEVDKPYHERWTVTALGEQLGHYILPKKRLTVNEARVNQLTLRIIN